ncbi:MAG: AI-2E family transporter [Proteobacteria bacterium]|nr:AI-2E family transporter [Pseudomonadota bacterium]
MEPNTIQILKRWGIGFLGLVAFLALVSQLQRLATLLILSFLISYLLNPVVTRLSSTRFIGRTVATIITIVALLLLILGIVLFVTPALIDELRTFFDHLPALVDRLGDRAIPWLERKLDIEIKVPGNWDELFQQILVQFSKQGHQALEPASRLAEFVFNATFSALFFFLGSLMFPVFLFFLLKDYPAILAVTERLIPRKYRRVTNTLATDVDTSLSAFFHGQFMVMIVLGVLYATGYWIVGIPMALTVGLLTGLLCFIPYVGAATGFVLALSLSLLQLKGWTPVLGVVIVFGSVQALDAVFVTPKILGKQLGLRPLWIILALMAGGEMFGFLGVLLAVPTTAVVKVLVLFSLERYRESALYRGDGPPTIPPGEVKAPSPDTASPTQSSSTPTAPSDS